MRFDRQSGVFLHLTSLPSPHGIGDLGPGAREFLDFLDRADQSLWQFCPLGPTSGAHGHSPYSSFSTFAGNPLLIDLRDLRERGWLTEDELEPPESFDPKAVAYDQVAAFKQDRLETAFGRFRSEGASGEFDAFRERADDWLADYALFAALKDEFDGAAWTGWPDGLADRDPDALSEYRASLSDRVAYHAFLQWVFDEQWLDLREAAADRGVSLIGDVPMYVALDSADVWADRDAFAIDGQRPTAVAGVPPNSGDDGQRWGTPVYDWEHLEATDYGWWLDRLGRLFDQVDLARLDHFKAFDEYWAIPVDSSDPGDGEWRPGPGGAFFETVREAFGEVPFVAEDLGFIDEGVLGLRRAFDIPGTRVPQYADWCAERHRYKPACYPRNCIAYTATHDTDTTVGYYLDLPEEERECLEYALGTDGSDIAWEFVDAVWNSEAALAMTTVPDLLGRGSEARFNTPGTATGNWRWRVRSDELSDDVADRLATVTAATLR
ncbi:MAG: 4-alpha-glucanotransferase [Halobacteriales archaeon]